MPLEKSEQTLTRNDQTVELYVGEFGKNSKENAGKKFLYPVLKDETWDRDILMIGRPFVCNRITRAMRAIFGAIFIKSWDAETGTLDQEAWLEAAQDFTEGEEKRDELQDRKNELSDKFALITESEDFMAHPEKYSEQLKAIGDEVQGINESLKRIQQDIDAKTAKRNATKAANAKKAAEANAASMARKQAA